MASRMAGACSDHGCQWPKGLGRMIVEHSRFRDELREAHVWLQAAGLCDCEDFEGAGTKLCRFAEVLGQADQ